MSSDEESEAVSTGGEERLCKKARLSAGGGIRTSSESHGLGEELKTQFACLRGELVAMRKHLGAIEEAVAVGWGDSAAIKEQLEDFTEEFTSFRGALEGA